MLFLETKTEYKTNKNAKTEKRGTLNKTKKEVWVSWENNNRCWADMTTISEIVEKAMVWVQTK